MVNLTVPNEDILRRDMPNQDKLILALEWLRENPTEKATTAARLFNIEKEDTVPKA
jgi:hypothetical protein